MQRLRAGDSSSLADAPLVLRFTDSTDMGKMILMVLSVPAPWLVFMLIGQPFSGILIIGAVLFMALLGTMLNTSLPAFLTILASIAWAMKNVQQHPTPQSRRRPDDFRQR